MVAEDEPISRLVVDPATGNVLLVDEASTRVLASAPVTFLACAEAYSQALREAADLEPDDEAALERIETNLLRRFTEAGADDVFWLVAAEEIGLGTSVATVPAPLPVATAAPLGILLALGEDELQRLFTAEQWKRLSTLAPVRTVRAPQLIPAAVEAAATMAGLRGKPAARTSVLVVEADAELTEATWAALPELRVLAVLGSERPGAPAGVQVVRLGREATGHEVILALEATTRAAAQ
nr:hypothetical protein [Kineosporia babensis]